MKKIFHVVFLFCSILFFNNQVFAVTMGSIIQDDKLTFMKIYCGKGRDGRSGWYDSFFATTIGNTFQGTRYWGDKQGGIGYEIFSGFRTKKKFIVKVKGREGKERWSYALKSDGKMSVIEHLSKGLKRTDETKAGKRKCEMKLGDSVPVRSAIAAENIRKNYNSSFEKVKKLEKEIIELKKQVSLLNTSLESEEKNKRLTEEKLKEQEKKQKIAEGKLKAQEKKQKTAEEKLKEQEKKQKIAEEKLKEQEKDQKIAEEKLKKQEKDQKISKEKRLLEELKRKIAEEKKKIKELNKQIE